MLGFDATVGRTTRTRRGLTLVELLVAMGIIGLLAAILLPAIQYARESGRRSACANNLHQIGLALQGYLDGHRTFPPAVIWSPAGEPLGGGLYPIGVIDRVARFAAVDQDTIFANWAVMLLPYLERDDVAAQFDLRQPIGAAANAAARATNVPTFLCPTDSYNAQPFLRGAAAGIKDNKYARGNYAINVGPDKGCLDNGPNPDNAPCVGGFFVLGTDLEKDNRQIWGQGIAGGNRSFGPRDVTDGLSQTVACDEIRAGIDGLDPRGVWALGQVGSSLTARHGMDSGAAGPNPTRSAEEIMGCGALQQKLGGPDALGDMGCLGGNVTDEVNAVATARSLHARGVQVLMCDGSVHFLSNSVAIEVWHALHTRSASDLARWDAP